MIKAWAQSQKGFTIVELLIVIVVIGILAAITITAYNGVQTRAENTKTTSAVSEYVKGFNIYATNNGTYPVDAGYPCLGAYPATKCANVTDSTGACSGSGSTTSQAGFDTKMKTVFSGSMPQPSTQQMNCGGKNYSGAYYTPTTGTTAVVVYFLRGNQLCEGISGVASYSRFQADDTTRCQAVLPTL